MHTSSIKGTFGAVLGSVSTTATTITTAIDAAGEGSAMLLAYARHHRVQQAKDYAMLSMNGDYLAQKKASDQMISIMRETQALNLTPAEQEVWNATFEKAGAALAALTS